MTERPLLDGLNEQEATMALFAIEQGIWTPNGHRPDPPIDPFYAGGTYEGEVSVCLMVGHVPFAYVDMPSVDEGYALVEDWMTKPPEFPNQLIDLFRDEDGELRLRWVMLDSSRWFVLDSNVEAFVEGAQADLNAALEEATDRTVAYGELERTLENIALDSMQADVVE